MDKTILKFIRKTMGYSQKRLGKEMGYTACYVNYIENGVRNVSKTYEQKFKQVLGLDEEDIMFYKMVYCKSQKNEMGAE